MAQALTNDQARKLLREGATPRDLVRLRWPEMADDECDFVLWELTPFPVISGVHDIVDAVSELPEPEDWKDLQ